MKKVLSVLLCIIMLFSFCSCGKEPEKNQSVAWHDKVAWLLGVKSYIAKLTTTDESTGLQINSKYAEFGGDISYVEFVDGEDTQKVYFTYRQEDGKDVCRIYGYSEEHDYWVGKQIDYSENYFYAYSFVEKIRKIGAYVDMGELVYNEDEHRYHGDNLSGSFVFEGVEHHVDSMKVVAVGNRIISVDELYKEKPDAEKQYRQTIEFSKIGDVHLELPKNSITYEDAVDKVGYFEFDVDLTL